MQECRFSIEGTADALELMQEACHLFRNQETWAFSAQRRARWTTVSTDFSMA